MGKSITLCASRQNVLLMPWLIVEYALCTTLADHPDTQSTVQTTRLCPRWEAKVNVAALWQTAYSDDGQNRLHVHPHWWRSTEYTACPSTFLTIDRIDCMSTHTSADDPVFNTDTTGTTCLRHPTSAETAREASWLGHCSGFLHPPPETRLPVFILLLKHVLRSSSSSWNMPSGLHPSLETRLQVFILLLKHPFRSSSSAWNTPSGLHPDEFTRTQNRTVLLGPTARVKGQGQGQVVRCLYPGLAESE